MSRSSPNRAAKHVVTPHGWPAHELLSQAVSKQGTPFYLSGQVGTTPEGTLAGDGAAQAEQAFSNVQTVVEACGGTIDDLVKLTIYVTDPALRPAIAEIRRRLFAPGAMPATTFLVVAALGRPDYLIEVEAIAVIDP